MVLREVGVNDEGDLETSVRHLTFYPPSPLLSRGNPFVVGRMPTGKVMPSID
jgi:hypothetical protein